MRNSILKALVLVSMVVYYSQTFAQPQGLSPLYRRYNASTPRGSDFVNTAKAKKTTVKLSGDTSTTLSRLKDSVKTEEFNFINQHEELEKKYNTFTDSLRNPLYQGKIDSLKKSQSAISASMNDIEVKLASTELYENEIDGHPLFPLFESSKTHNISGVMNYIYGDKKFSAFQSFSTQFLNSGYITTEFGSALFGKFRLGLSGYAKTSGDTTKDNLKSANIQKLVSGGGSVALTLSTPILFFRSQDDNTHGCVFLFSNLGFAPVDSTASFSQSFSQFKFINQIGLQPSFDFLGSPDGSGLQKTARVAVDFPFYYSWGPDYLKQLSFTDFWLLQFRGSVSFNNLVSISVTGCLWSSIKAIQTSPFSLSLSFSPSQVLASATK